MGTKQSRMTTRFIQSVLFLHLASCGSSFSSTAQQASSSGLPFAISEVTTFDSPWAMAFLPGSRMAIVTEKRGRLWLVDVTSGRKQPVADAPRVVVAGQGGLLDVKLSPTFTSDAQLYLTYSEASPNGGSGLALARARLVRDASGARLQNLSVLWHDPSGGEGGQF